MIRQVKMFHMETRRRCLKLLKFVRVRKKNLNFSGASGQEFSLTKNFLMLNGAGPSSLQVSKVMHRFRGKIAQLLTN